MVIRPEAAADARAVFDKWGVDFAVIGRVTETGRFVLKAGGAVVGDLPVRPLVDEAPIYERPYELTPRPAPLARPRRTAGRPRRSRWRRCRLCWRRPISAPSAGSGSNTTTW